VTVGVGDVGVGVGVDGSGVGVDGSGVGVGVDGSGVGVVGGTVGVGVGVPPLIAFQTARSGFIWTAGLTVETVGAVTPEMVSPPASIAVVPVGEIKITEAFWALAVVMLHGVSQKVVYA
jgi:hypothetical protein